MRDTCSYSFYYDTKYGAVGTLNAKTGNCVDHSHLLVAMFRTAGLAARYAHGTCTFSSGSTFGHVWTQVLTGDTWTVADATSSRNSLGKVANWNAYSYKLHSYSSAIAFYFGYDKLTNYYNSENFPRLNRNAYVGGDAYNYIINGTYFSGYLSLIR